MNDLQSRMKDLSPAKRALLERKLRDKAVRQEREPIQAGSAGPTPALSFGQQRLWFLDQWQPGSAAYNITQVYRVSGTIVADAIERALTEIVRRHEALRTTFETKATTPVQIIHPPIPVVLQRIDLTTVPSDGQEAAARKRINEIAVRPFDLTQRPLYRFALLTLANDRHLLQFTMHHIVSDGWSMGVLYSELSTLYSAFIGGQPSPLPELPIQYADFAVWQRRYLQGETVAEQLSYWRQQLRDLPTLELPTDHPRPPIQTFAGTAITTRLPGTLAEGLKSIARQEGATLFMALLAAFQTLLHRYTGQDDIVVGAPIAGRTRVELEPLIGFFVNTLVLRTDTSSDPSFRELLGRVKKVAAGAYAYQEVPFEQLVDEVQPRRDASRNPMFQVMFALQNTPGQSLSLGDATTQKITTDKLTIHFDLEVHVAENRDGFDAMYIYNTALFEAGTIERMARHFATLMEGIVANPDQRLSQLPVLTPREKYQLLMTLNETETEYPRESCIQQIFERRADEFPDQIAVTFGKRKVTYRELNERSNQIAHQLRALNVGPDALVAVCAERSVDMVVGLLATLKAGGAYLPLDPSYPQERLAFMIAETNARVLLTQEKLRSEFAQSAPHVFCLDADQFDAFPRENPTVTTTPTNLAYVIYTSGSTGRPKGVAVPHRAVIRVVLNTNYITVTSADRVAQACNTSFDVAVFEYWGALLNGATLVGIPQNILLAPRQLAEFLGDQKVTVLFLTPALLNQVVNEVPAAFRSLRCVLAGGDVFDPKSGRKILQHGPPQCLVNIWGPAESTVFATSYVIESVSEFATSIPIGKAISNTRVYILDRNLQPVPIGVTGELYVGGDAVARGYFNRPELTAEKFIRDPFSSDPTHRLYRTGDFGRYLADGNIDFLGRMDHQVKIRGFRIELQEIESVLSQHPSVGTSVVIARQFAQGDKRLLAYVVPAASALFSVEDLRRFLRTQLPDYMVPSAFIPMEALPLTPNGKVDRTGLPDPEQVADSPTRRLVDPHTSIEEKLAEMWKELLGLKRISTAESFFSLGGHSLLAIQLVARIEKSFHITLPVATLFQYPTIAELAQILESEALPETWSCLIPVQPEGSKLPFFWVHGDSSNSVLPEYLGLDQPLYGLEHQAHDGSAAVHKKVESIANHYLNEVRAVHAHGPYLLGGFSFGALVAFEMAQQLNRAGEEVLLLFMLDPPCYEKHAPASDTQQSVWQQVLKHSRELLRLPGKKKLDYIALRINDQLSGPTTWITDVVRKLRWKLCLATGRRLPVSLRSHYILDSYNGAVKTYVPQPYAGRVILFKSRNAWYPASMNWFSLITGELSVFEGAGAHMDLKNEPYVAQWAEQLKASLDQVRVQL